jgi:hypothetical protein
MQKDGHSVAVKACLGPPSAGVGIVLGKTIAELFLRFITRGQMQKLSRLGDFIGQLRGAIACFAGLPNEVFAVSQLNCGRHSWGRVVK